ncbi:Fanconi anemia group J protein [Linnemannia zychae]|nr:Fanconi anemia group J protein [Linnemannia zychae]
MGKRSRNLPPTIAGKGDNGKKTASTTDQDPFKQLLLNIQLHDSSDSESNDFQGSSSNNTKRAKKGHFQVSRKKDKAGESSETVIDAPSPAANPTEFLTHGIVEALQNEENALLESPTGSGKSLALLCGALAWLEAAKARNDEIRKETRKKIEEELAKQKVVVSPYFSFPDTGSAPTMNNGCGSCAGDCGPTFSSVTDQGEALMTSIAPATTNNHNTQHNTEQHIGANITTVLQYDDDATKNTGAVKTTDAANVVNDILNLRESTQQVPKIYFGSRTHKQITQLVKELKSNTVYRPKIAVLGSRKHYCVNNRIQKASNLNDACQELVENDGCPYKFRANDLQEKFSIKKIGQNRIWDMEDLIEEGKGIRGCPYFASRSLTQGAELIFCPYSYLIDPQIRKAMDIEIEKSIVILDEAHNIEDASREAGGLDVPDNDLTVAKTEFSDMIKHNIMAQPCHTLLNLSQMFLSILEKQTTFSIQEYEQSTEVWTAQKLLGHLESFGLNADSISTYNTAFQELAKAVKDKKEKREKKEKKKHSKSAGTHLEIFSEESNDTHFEEQFVAVSPQVMRTLEGLITILQRLFSNNGYYLEDYRIALVESVDHSRSGATINVDSSTEVESGDDVAQAIKSRHYGRDKQNGWGGFGKQSARRGAQVAKKREFKFWCLNPGVIFGPLSSAARSVILTSGTLSPMDSFASELQTRFAVQLEAGHVVQKSQVWAGVLPYGPTRVKMDGTYRSASSFQFQDELGRAIHRIIQTTPHGVLCFVSSYTLMDNLVNRWRTTGQYDEFCNVKKVILEPRRASTKEFNKILKSFYDHIASEVAKGSNGGAILFAVFRGKCSEGIDFTDANCRAVLAVSIPYPGMKDLKINLKKEYNDQQCKKRRQQNQIGQAGQSGKLIPGVTNINLSVINHSTGSSEQSAAHASLVTPDTTQSRSLLSGSRWYEIQAFRAYNQAIGRCIRHRKDWGAMILLDHRLTFPSSKNSLSRWVRPLVNSFPDFEVGMYNLKSWLEPLQQGIGIEDSVATSPAATTIIDTNDSGDLAVMESASHVAEPKLIVKNEIVEPPVNTNAEITTLMPDASEQLDHQLIAAISDEFAFKWEDDMIPSSPKTKVQPNPTPTDSYDFQEIASIDSDWEKDSEAPLVDTIEASSKPKSSTNDQDGDSMDDMHSEFGSDADMSGLIEEDLKEDSLLSPFPLPNEPILTTTEFAEMQTHEHSTDTKLNLGHEAPRDSIVNIVESMENGMTETGSNIMGFPSSPTTSKITPIFPTDPISHLEKENMLISHSTDSISWSLNNATHHHASTSAVSAIESQVAHPFGNTDVLRIVCKTCNELLIVCSQRPKIKTVERFMAAELLSHRRRLNCIHEPQGSSSSPTQISQRSGFGAPPSFHRTLSGLSSSSSTTMSIGPPRAMILTVHGSSVLETPFEGSMEQEELECVFRPRDGLFYRRIICPRCCLMPIVVATDQAATEATSAAPSMTSQSQKIIPGWKGVIIVGSLSEQHHNGTGVGGEGGDDTSDIGTIWLTPGEIKTL